MDVSGCNQMLRTPSGKGRTRIFSRFKELFAIYDLNTGYSPRSRPKSPMSTTQSFDSQSFDSQSSGFPPPPPPIPNFGGLIVLSILASLVGFIIFAVIVYCFVQKFKNSTVNLQFGSGSMIRAPPPGGLNLGQVWTVDAATMERFLHEIAKEQIVRFTAQELCSFTNNYSTRLGSGGFGIVYEGKFPNGVKIAVKVLNRNSNNKKVEEQFMAEVGTIGKTYHINLVRLYGFCFDNFISALVYEYMENSSLDKFLFSTETPQIEWKKLEEIAIGTAKGLAYLHEECQQRIIHYDIKPGNVLLDLNFSPKVADFGLAELCNRDITHVSCSGYRGTPGYSAPEFLMHSYPITHKCDVYSFGMLLFEIARRRRNMNTNNDDTFDWFPKKAWQEFEKDGLKDLITMEINGIEEKDKEAVERMFMVALWCVQESPDSRPLMSTVVKMLEGEVEILPPPNPFRYLYGSGTGDAAGGTAVSSSYAITGRTNSSWYENTTPVMRKYEIQIATS